MMLNAETTIGHESTKTRCIVFASCLRVFRGCISCCRRQRASLPPKCALASCSRSSSPPSSPRRSCVAAAIVCAPGRRSSGSGRPGARRTRRAGRRHADARRLSAAARGRCDSADRGRHHCAWRRLSHPGDGQGRARAGRVPELARDGGVRAEVPARASLSPPDSARRRAAGHSPGPHAGARMEHRARSHRHLRLFRRRTPGVNRIDAVRCRTGRRGGSDRSRRAAGRTSRCSPTR